MIRVLMLLAVMAFAASAGTVYRAPSAVETAEYLGTDSGPMVRFNLTALETIDSTLEGYGNGIIFRIPGGGYGAEVGTPDVPSIRRMVQIPSTGDISLEIVDVEYSVLGNYSVLPAQPFPERTAGPLPLKVNNEVYSTSAFYPATPVSVERLSILRDIRVAWLRFDPVMVNPVTGETRIATSVTVRLASAPGQGENELQRAASGVTRSFIPYYSEVLGFEPTDAIIDGSYLVIGSQEAVDLCEDLIQWKREKGYDVQIGLMEDIGFSSGQVNSYIEDAFNTWANPPEWLLLLGDEVGVPAYWVGSIAADNQYGVIGTGVDPSIHVGRLTADTGTLNYVSWKILNYEKNPYEPADSWFQYGVCLGSSDFTDPLQSWRHKQIMSNDGDMYVTLYCPNTSYGGINPTVANISAELNNGVSLFSYIGHGSRTSWGTTGFSNSDVNALTNNRRLVWISSIACVNSQFASGGSGDCFGEAWLKAGSIAEPKGAVGFMGATVNSPVGPTDSLAIFQLRGYFQLDMHHMGQAFDYGKIKAYEYTGNAGNSNMHMIMGEPEHDIFTTTGPLVHMSAAHAGSVSPGSFQVTVTAAGSAVENALVGLCQGQVTLASARTNSSGIANLSVPSIPTGDDVTLTLTAHNLYPLQTMLSVGGTGTAEQTSGLIEQVHLSVPTPVTGSAAVSYTVPQAGHARLSVFDMTGRVVATLVDGEVAAGQHSVNWNADLSGGIYFLRLDVPGQSLVKNCVVLR